MTLPSVGTHPEAELGVAVVSRIVFKSRADGGLGQVFRKQEAVDVGIDGHIEIVEEGFMTGRIVGVQVKAGEAFFRNEDAESWTVYIKQATVHYWRVYSVPVL